MHIVEIVLEVVLVVSVVMVLSDAVPRFVFGKTVMSSSRGIYVRLAFVVTTLAAILALIIISK